MVVAAVAAHALGNLVGELLDAGMTGSVAELILTGLAAAVVLLTWRGTGRRTPAVR